MQIDPLFVVDFWFPDKQSGGEGFSRQVAPLQKKEGDEDSEFSVISLRYISWNPLMRRRLIKPPR